MIGVGVYALSEEGRGRFGAFPDVIADDGYVRMLFSPSERIHVDDAPVRIYAPAGVSDLVRIKTRSRLGRYQLRQRYPDLVARERTTKSYRGAIVDDRDPTLALAGRGVVRGRPRPDTPSSPLAAHVRRRLRVGTRSVVTSTRPALT